MTQRPQPEQHDASTEAALLRRLRAGEEAAFEELVLAHGGRMLATVRRITRSQQDAEDAVQEAFLSAFRSLAAFDGRSSLGTWLHRIAVNAALDRVRRERARPRVSIEALLPVFANGAHAEEPSPWAAAAQGELSDAERRNVWAALSQLPDEYRDVIVLRDVEGLESKAVAAALGISDATARQRLHRARQAVTKLLQSTMNRGTT